jgi:AcrR family transcriptional regulator
MRKRGEGRERLIAAARLEFEELGYDGTNTNAIARRAGYAPQTFYRHFADKRAIFVAVYQDWLAEEVRAVSAANGTEAIADALIHHHKAHRKFRLSLRVLTVSDPEVATVRAAARREQLQALSANNRELTSARGLAAILKIERLCDAIADGEFAACGVDESDARAEVIALVEHLF